MHAQTKTLLLMMGLVSIFLWHCSDEDVIFIPNLDQQWVNQADPSKQNTFFFLVDQNNVSSSNFTGNENPIGGGNQYSFAGSFKNHNIEFTYNNNSGNKSNKKYTGTIDNTSTIIEINNPQLGSLTLKKE